MSKQGKADIVYKMLTKQTNKQRTSKSPPIIDLESALKKEPQSENAILRLSIEDYELMCKNKRYREAMANVLNTNIDYLTAFCKDVKILDNYVDLNATTIKEKKIAKRLPIKILLSDLPDESLKLITEKFKTLLKYELRDWLPSNKLGNDFVSANPNAVDFFSLPQNRRLIAWHILSENPNAVDFLSLPENKKFIFYHYLSCNKSSNPKLIKLLKDYIKANPRSMEINWKELSKNKYAIDILTSPENYDHIDWKGLSSNPSPEAIEFLLLDKNIDHIKWREFSSNPCDSAIKFLKANQDYIDWGGLSSNTNPRAIPLIAKKVKEENILSPAEYDYIEDKVNWNYLSANPNAIDLIIAKIKDGNRLDDINWNALSENPAIFYPFKKNRHAKGKIIARLLSSNLMHTSAKTGITNLPSDLHRKIVRDFISLSKNILRDGIPIDKLNWSYLCKNPNAIELLSKRMDFEKGLSKDEYDRLPYKINWSSLCSNSDPGAIELLSLPENYDKIDWLMLSSNSNAIKLLEDRVKYQLGLNYEQLERLSIHERISWQKLSANPSIFVPK